MVFDGQRNTRISRIARPAFLRHYPPMTATLEQIHEDPAILDRAIFQRERIDVISGGVVAATFTPVQPSAQRHSVLDIPTRDLGPMLKPLADEDDLLGEMMEERE